jgi:hypothetical protein
VIEKTEVDHFLPFSMMPLDGLTNLVAAHEDCNGSKSDSFAAMAHLKRWMLRTHAELAVVGAAASWPLEWERTNRVVRRMYQRLDPQTPVWFSTPGVYEVRGVEEVPPVSSAFDA